MGRLKIKCSITTGGGPRRGARGCQSFSEAKSPELRRHGSSQTIFLMLWRLKLPALRCFCTWLAEPCRILPLLECPAVGESSTFSLSIPAGRQHKGRG